MMVTIAPALQDGPVGEVRWAGRGSAGPTRVSVRLTLLYLARLIFCIARNPSCVIIDLRRVVLCGATRAETSRPRSAHVNHECFFNSLAGQRKA